MSTSSCRTTPFELFTNALDEVKNLMLNQTKKVSRQMTEMKDEISCVTSQVTGLRSVVRSQAAEIQIVITTVLPSTISRKPSQI